MGENWKNRLMVEKFEIRQNVIRRMKKQPAYFEGRFSSIAKNDKTFRCD